MLAAGSSSRKTRRWARRAGKAVLLLENERAAIVRAIDNRDDAVAVPGNRKLLIFPLGELPVMVKGRGVLLQRYRDASLADLTTFAMADGLSWRAGRGMRTEPTCTRGSANEVRSATRCPSAFHSAIGSRG